MSKQNKGLLLGHDEGDVHAVRGEVRRCSLPGSGVKHRQCRQGLRDTTTLACHGPQLTAVPMDGVVMVKLEPEHYRWSNKKKEKCRTRWKGKRGGF